MSHKLVVGPIFFEKTITTEMYHDIISNLLHFFITMSMMQFFKIMILPICCMVSVSLQIKPAKIVNNLSFV